MKRAADRECWVAMDTRPLLMVVDHL